MNKIIFLDIDGVLNSVETAAAIQKITGKRVIPGPVFVEEPFTRENLNWGRIQFDLLRYIVENTKASIVISSAWGEKFWIGQFIDMFNQYGWFGAPIVALTPRYMTNRGQEIDAWFEKMKDLQVYIDRYVILDDNDDFSNHQAQHHLVLTNKQVGLTVEDAEKAIKILNRI